MNKLLYAILLCAAAIASGCGQPENRGIDNEKLLDGVTLDAIKPSHPLVPDVAQHRFSVHVFKLPAENFSTVEQLFTLLDRENLHIINENVFKSNGFDVGVASDLIWPQVAQLLDSANARKRATHNVILTEDAAQDIRASASRRPRRIDYINLASENVQMTLDSGELVWRLEARNVTQQRGQALVKIEAVYSRFMTTVLAKVEEQRKKNEHTFDFSSLRLRLNEGEFVILGPSKYDPKVADLASLYFTGHADFLMPVESEDRTGKPRYKMRRDIPLIYLYIIHCDRVDS